MPDGNVGGQMGFGEMTLRMFERELTQCIIPFVEKITVAETEPGNRALAGLSMGELQTLFVGINNAEMFPYLGVFSSGWMIPAHNDLAAAQYEFIKNNPEKVNSLRQFWISMGGREDIAWNNCQAMLKKLDELNVKYTYSEYPGGHAWPVWRNNLYNFAQLLFR